MPDNGLGDERPKRWIGEPMHPGRFGDASKLTLVIALGLPASIVCFVVAVGAGISMAGKSERDPIFIVFGSILAGCMLLGMLSVPAAIITATKEALAEVYQHHHAALVDETRRLLAPDRYGTRDEAAAAREFAHFYDHVARPYVMAKQGVSAETVDTIFGVVKADLLRRVIAKVLMSEDDLRQKSSAGRPG